MEKFLSLRELSSTDLSPERIESISSDISLADFLYIPLPEAIFCCA
ncbi:MAG: hypothetical protein M1371_05570 [Actinobacteria bacterium]|nr:hypothetical protein [Actinomycetota bacterium]